MQIGKQINITFGQCFNLKGSYEKQDHCAYSHILSLY